MCCQKTHALSKCRWPATQDERKSEHCPGQVFYWNVDYDKMCLLAGIILCKGVDEGEYESGGEDVIAQEKTRRCL